MSNYFLSIGLFLFLSCNNAAEQTSQQADTSASPETPHANGGTTGVVGAKPMVLDGCYQMILKRDTANLKLAVQDTTVTGDLAYYLFERDRNSGTIRGVLRDDMIYADYYFESEGMKSVREVVFKIENNTLVQAFGDLTETNGKVVFQDRSQLQFQTANPFFKIACL